MSHLNLDTILGNQKELFADNVKDSAEQEILKRNISENVENEVLNNVTPPANNNNNILETVKEEIPVEDISNSGGLLSEIMGSREDINIKANTKEIPTVNNSNNSPLQEDLNDINLDQKPKGLHETEDVSNGTVLDERSAEMYVMTVDLFSGKLCAALAGEESDKKFRLSKEDYARYVKVSKSYFQTVQVQLSPTTLFIAITGILLGGNFFNAFKIRKEKENIKIAREKFEKQQLERMKKNGENGKTIPLFPSMTDDQINDTGTVQNPPPRTEEMERTIIRRNFNYDSDFYYEYNEEGVRIKKAQRIEKASPDVIAMKKAGLKNKAILKKIMELNKPV